MNRPENLIPADPVESVSADESPRSDARALESGDRLRPSMTVTEALEDISFRALIYLNARGQIVYESIIELQYPVVDIDLLLDCCSDNLIEEAGEERIHWPGVLGDYEDWR